MALGARRQQRQPGEHARRQLIGVVADDSEEGFVCVRGELRRAPARQATHLQARQMRGQLKGQKRWIRVDAVDAAVFNDVERAENFPEPLLQCKRDTFTQAFSLSLSILTCS